MNPFTSIIAHGLVGQTVQVHTLAGHGLVGQTVQVHTLAGQFAGTLEALIGGVVRIRGGGTVYDVDLAHVVAISYPTSVPVPRPGGVMLVSATTAAPRPRVSIRRPAGRRRAGAGLALGPARRTVAGAAAPPWGVEIAGSESGHAHSDSGFTHLPEYSPQSR